MSDSSISPPSTPSSQTLCAERTNSLIVTQLPPTFFHPLVIKVLRDHFATYGDINQWVPIAGLARIIVVYNHENDAEEAKLRCDPLVLEATEDRPETVLRVYRSTPSPLIDSFSAIADENYLRPPAIEKNFLISPPGSPPVGWEPIKEDPPNATPLADDLIAALRKLQVHNQKRSSREILLEPEDGVGVTVYVEECGVDEDGIEPREEDWIYGQASPARMKWAPIPTSLPPMTVS